MSWRDGFNEPISLCRLDCRPTFGGWASATRTHTRRYHLSHGPCVLGVSHAAWARPGRLMPVNATLNIMIKQTAGGHGAVPTCIVHIHGGIDERAGTGSGVKSQPYLRRPASSEHAFGRNYGTMHT